MLGLAPLINYMPGAFNAIGRYSGVPEKTSMSNAPLTTGVLAAGAA